MNQGYQMVNPYLVGRQQQQSNGINWVQGIEGAKAWQLPANSNILLMDSENDGRFYIKISDNIGMCSMRVFDYVEVTQNIPQQSRNTGIDLSEYVKKSELETLIRSMIGGNVNEQSIPTVEHKQSTGLLAE